MQVDSQKNGCWSSRDLKGFTGRWSMECWLAPHWHVAEEGQPVEMPTKLMSHQAGFRLVVQDELWHLLQMWGRNSLPGWFALQNHSRCVEEDDQRRLEWHAFPGQWKQSDMSSFSLPTYWLTVVDSVENKLKSHGVRVILSIYFQDPHIPRVRWFPMVRHDSCGWWKECKTRWVEHCRVQDSEIG